MDRFRERFKVLEPNPGVITGTLHPAKEGSFGSFGNANLTYDRLFFRTPFCQRTQPGTIIAAREARYLLALHQDYKRWFRSYRCFRITNEVEWSRLNTEEVIDPVTRLPRSSTGVPESLGTIQVALERLSAEESDRGTNIREAKYQMFSRQELKEGDQVGNFRVLRSDFVLGIWMAEVQ